MRRATPSRALLGALALAVAGGLVTGIPAAIPDAAAAAGCAGSQGCVEVFVPGSASPVSFTVAQINALADVHNASYTTRIAGGATLEDTPHVMAGLSIGQLLVDASPGINLNTVTFTAVPRPSNGTWSTLTTPDLLPGSDFQDGLLPCVFFDGSQLHYVRPLRSDTDTNGTDSFQVAPGADLEVHAYTGPELSVGATASSTGIKAGQSVDFSGTVSGAGSGATLDYEWTVDNGAATHTISTAPNPSYRFLTAGVYEVLLTATGSDGSAGLSTPIFVTVGSAPTSPGHPTPGPGRSASPHPPTSPPATGGPKPSTGSSSPTPSKGAPGAGHGRASASPSAVSANGGGSTPSATPSPAANLPAAGAPLVDGRLIGQTAALPLASGNLESTAAGSAAEPLSDGWRAPAVLAWVAAIMLLFTAGALGERHRNRRRRSG
jgi:PKD domain